MSQTPVSKAVVISGGAQGIGRCLARTALAKGYRVYILDIKEEELKYTVDEHLKQYAPNVAYSICNLRDIPDIRRCIKKAADFFGGRIDILINNGGVASPKWRGNKTMEDEDTLEQWQAYVETNLTAPFVVSQACIPFMKRPEGEEALHHTAGPCIIHVGSFRAYTSDADQEGYASTKAGLVGLMHSMAISCERWGIRVNIVAPGRIKVAHECKEGDERGTGWEQTDADIVSHPTNRAGTPEDIANCVWYLTDAGFVTGQDIIVDGGTSKKKST